MKLPRNQTETPAEQVSHATPQPHKIKNELMLRTAQLAPHKNRHAAFTQEFAQATKALVLARGEVELLQQLIAELAPLDKEISLNKERLRQFSQATRKLDAEISQLSQQHNFSELITEEEQELSAKLKSLRRRYDLLSPSSGLSPSLLIAGEACPLCGSREHPLPLAAENQVKNSEILRELQTRISAADEELEKLRQRRSAAESAQKQQGMWIKEWERLEAERLELSLQTHALMVTRGTLINDANLEDQEVTRELERRKKIADAAEQRLNAARGQHTASEIRLVKLQTEIESLTKQLAGLDAALNAAN